MKGDFISKNKDNRNLWVLVSVIFLLLSTAFMTKPGYCRGWWGKQNLIMRSLWLCSCPPDVEQTFYPPNVEVMFSACQEVTLMPTWDGYFFITGDESYSLTDSYLLDGFTGEKIAYTPPESHRLIYFLTNELIYLGYAPGEFRPPELHHRTENWSMPIELVRESIPPPFLDNGTVNPGLISLFDESQKIFVVRYTNIFIISLDVNTSDEIERSFILVPSDSPDFRDLGARWPIEFLEASGLTYISIPPPEWSRLPPYRMSSPDGRFVATGEGVYESVINQQITPLSFAHEYVPCCWFPNSDAVVYVPNLFPLTTWELSSPALEQFTRLMKGFPLQMEARSAPILKVHIPEE